MQLETYPKFKKFEYVKEIWKWIMKASLFECWSMMVFVLMYFHVLFIIILE